MAARGLSEFPAVEYELKTVEYFHVQLLTIKIYCTNLNVCYLFMILLCGYFNFEIIVTWKIA